MNDSSDNKLWACWLVKGIERSAPCIFVGFLIWCACKYAVSDSVWFVIALLVLLLF